MSNVISVITVILICILILVLARISTRFLGSKMRGSARGKFLEIIDEVPVGSDRYVFIVVVENKAYLCGSSGGNISLLTELPEVPEEPPAQNSDGGQGFKELFMENLKKYSGFTGKDRRR
jgi:flagellar protein FliO/FliZ